ncbi:imelysin family protein [Roseateles sp. BYS180W]|uniref:Imelysin family protein n=1 Tax=Roseateles rivi TaxID=3299028 RepID=A0ABW7FYW8_9BURK
MPRHAAPWTAALALTSALAAALPAWAQTAASATAPSSAQAATVHSVTAHYAALVHATYSDTLTLARTLQAAVQAFVAAPSAQTQAQAQQAWLAAREYYGQTEAFRFYGGPIDDARGPEGRLNAWPMDESYVDYVEGQPRAGLINQPRQPITAAALSAANERGGEENVATGWHAIEFLLWGQDRSEQGPGARSHEDFVVGKTPNAERRARYLRVVTDLLVQDLQSLVKAWAPGHKNNYRAAFERGGQGSLRKMLVGLGSLSRGELAGERLEVALSSQDQEDEHSCFSDNTHRDAVSNARGIENVWLGRFVRLDGSTLQGPALRDLVAARDAALAEKATRQIRQSVQASESIPAPFDRAIGIHHPGRARIEATIESLTAQSHDLVAAAAALGIKQLTLVQP